MLSYDFWFKTLRDSRVRAAKDHGKKFRSRQATSFSGILHSSFIGYKIRNLDRIEEDNVLDNAS